MIIKSSYLEIDKTFDFTVLIVRNRKSEYCIWQGLPEHLRESMKVIHRNILHNERI